MTEQPLYGYNLVACITIKMEDECGESVTREQEFNTRVSNIAYINKK